MLTHAQTMAVFVRFAADHGLDAAVAAIAKTRKAPVRALSPWIRAVCTWYDISPKQLLAGGRCKSLVDARHVAMWLLRNSGGSYPVIAKMLGGMDHTSVLHGVRRVETTPELLEQAREILARIEHGGEIGKRAA